MFSNNIGSSNNHILMEVAADDALRDVKLPLLRELGAGRGRAADLAALPMAPDALAAARVLVMRTYECDAWGAPSAAALRDTRTACLGPRNEAAALALLHAHAAEVCGGGGENDDNTRQRRAALAELSAGYCERVRAWIEDSGVAADEADAVAAATADADPAAVALLEWARARGLETSLRPATFEGGLRGLAAAEALPAGAVALSLPADLLITYETARRSDFGAALARIPGLGDDALALIWTMVERHDEEAAAAPFWAALPARFCTGLSAPRALVALLAGTPAATRFEAARAHLTRDFAALAPVFEALLRAYAAHLRPEWFSWESFLWAAELWYAYAIQAKLEPGAAVADPVPALAPVLSLLNHRPLAPHVVRFSEAEAASAGASAGAGSTAAGGPRLRLRLLRPVAAGEEFALSYGPLPNAELLLFYGFAVRGNPAEEAEVDLLAAAAAAAGAGGAGGAARREALRALGLEAVVTLRPGWRRRQMARLLPAARVLAASEAQLRAWLPKPAASKSKSKGKGGRGKSSGGGGIGGSGKAAAAAGAWPMCAAPSSGGVDEGAAENEAAAEQLLLRAATLAAAPYERALERVRAAADDEGGASAADDAEEGPAFSPGERRAFLRHLEAMLSDSVDLLLGPK